MYICQRQNRKKRSQQLSINELQRHTSQGLNGTNETFPKVILLIRVKVYCKDLR